MYFLLSNLSSQEISAAKPQSKYSQLGNFETEVLPIVLTLNHAAVRRAPASYLVTMLRQEIKISAKLKS